MGVFVCLDRNYTYTVVHLNNALIIREIVISISLLREPFGVVVKASD